MLWFGKSAAPVAQRPAALLVRNTTKFREVTERRRRTPREPERSDRNQVSGRAARGEPLTGAPEGTDTSQGKATVWRKRVGIEPQGTKSKTT